MNSRWIRTRRRKMAITAMPVVMIHKAETVNRAASNEALTRVCDEDDR